MFKFLLVGINSKFIHTNPAIRSLKAYAGEQYDQNIELAEYTINNQKSEILADIYKREPDAIGFSVYIWNADMVLSLLGELAQILPNVDVFLGGPEVSYNPDDYLNMFNNVKGVFVGEGEVAFKELISLYADKDIDKREGLHNIRGLKTANSYPGDSIAVKMDDLPFFYDKALVDSYVNKIIYYESSRGCPFRCSYCMSSIEKNIRLREFEKVREELKFFLDMKVPQVKFIDRTFNCNPGRALKIWNFISENDNKITNFHFEIAADILTPEEISVLQNMRPGLVQLEIGVQTTNQATLKAINRVTDIDKLRSAVSKLQVNNNVHLHLDLIAGLPYEDYDSFKNSFNDVFEMGGNQLQLGFLKLLKGAPIYSEVQKYGIKYSPSAPYEVLATDWISFDEIMHLKNVEKIVDTFYNSAQFTKSLQYVMSKFSKPFEFFDSLAKYYDRMGYFVMTPKRSRKYDIMLEFWQAMGFDGLEDLRELLTLDYYLREKPKSKPDFVINVPQIGVINYEITDPITGNHVLN